MKKQYLLGAILLLLLSSLAYATPPSYNTTDYTANWLLNDTFYICDGCSNVIIQAEGVNQSGGFEEAGNPYTVTFTANEDDIIPTFMEVRYLSSGAYTTTINVSVNGVQSYYESRSSNGIDAVFTPTIWDYSIIPQTGDTITISSTSNRIIARSDTAGAGSQDLVSWTSQKLFYQAGNGNSVIFSQINRNASIKDQTNNFNGTGYGKTFYDGTVNGATWNTSNPVGGNLAKYGGYYDFDGDDDYIDTGSSVIQDNTSFSLGLWFNRKEDKDAMLIGNGDNTNGFYVFDRGTSNDIRFRLSGSSMDIGAFSTNLDEWIYLFWSFEQGNSCVYQNGVLITCEERYFPNSANDNLKLGAFYTGVLNFNGSIDEVRIWDRALSQSEIQAEMNSSHPVNNEGLVAYYGFNDYVNATFTPDQNHLTQGYASQVYDVDDWAYSYEPATYFDGVDDYVVIQDSPTFNMQDFTLSAWIYLDSSSSERRRIISQQDGGLYWLMAVRADGFELGSSLDGILARRGSLSIGEWYHLVGVRDTSKNVLSYYINGENIINETANNDNIYNINANVHISTNDILSSEFFNGSIANVRIYNRSLSQIEIDQLYDENKNSFIHINSTDVFNGSEINATPEKEGITFYYSNPYYSAAIQNGSQVIEFLKSGYFNENQTIFIDEYNYDYTWQGIPENLLNLTFRDEATNNIINQNITVLVQTDTTEATFVIQNGSGIIRDLSLGTDYRLVFQTDNYTERSDQFTSDEVFFNSATYYLTESSNVNVENVEITILDDNGRDLEGVTIVIKAAVDGTYTQVEELVTDINGEVVASLDTSKRHLFEISKSGYQNKSFFINEPLVTAYTFTINDLVQVDFDNELDGILYSYDPGKGVLIYNRSYVFNWSVSSPTDDLTSLYASRFIIREYNSSGELQNTYVNTSTNTSGELLTLSLDLSNKINSTIEFIFCFQKQGFSEYCLAKKLTVLPERVSSNNLYGIRDYVADNYSEGQRIMMWLMAWVIVSIIFAAIPFMRNILIVIPVMLSGLFFGWLFLPIVYLTMISVFLFIVIGLLVVRSNV